MRRVALFDLDGTLTRTTDVDGACFLAAVEAELGVVADSNWGRYRHCTDEGIATELWLRHRGAVPSVADLARLRHETVALLRAAASIDPRRFLPVPGAAALLRHLRDEGWSCAIATGSWEASARLKLGVSGLPTDLPLFASDGCPSREAILARALVHAATASPGGASPLAVAIGDGPWDVAAATALGLAFLGIGTGARADRLRVAGATWVIADYSDLSGAMQALEAARPPGPRAGGPAGSQAPG